MLDKVIDKIENKYIRFFVKEIANIARVVLSVGIFGLIVFYTFNYINPFFQNDNGDYNSFHALPSDSMDVIVLGSSHAQYSFIPTLFNQKTGLYSYVLGSACQPYEVSYEMLKEALKTQSPELVIMEVFTATPASSICEGDSCYVTAGYMMSGEERYKTFDYLDEEKAISYRNDFINNHNNWKDKNTFKEIIKKKEYTLEDIDEMFGYRWIEPEFPVWNYWNPLKFSEFIEVELNELDLLMLNNIKRLCDDNNIQLMLYMTPMDGLNVENQSYRYKIWQWCEENNVLYVDEINDGDKLDYWMIVHNDGAHANITGAAITTTNLSKFVLDNYSFKKHRDNYDLDYIYKQNNEGVIKAILIYEYDPLKYTDYISDYNGISIIRYTKQNGHMNNEVKNNLLKMGVDQDFDKNDMYFAIIDNNELILSQTHEGEVWYRDRKITFHDWGIDLDDTNIDYEGNFSIITFKNVYNDFITKKIDLSKSRAWEYGYNWYGE